MGALGLFPCNKMIPVKRDRDLETRSVLQMASLLRNFALVAVSTEKLTLQWYDVGKGSKHFRVVIDRY